MITGTISSSRGISPKIITIMQTLAWDPVNMETLTLGSRQALIKVTLALSSSMTTDEVVTATGVAVAVEVTSKGTAVVDTIMDTLAAEIMAIKAICRVRIRINNTRIPAKAYPARPMVAKMGA
jgi:hypothetical protein